MVKLSEEQSAGGVRREGVLGDPGEGSGFEGGESGFGGEDGQEAVGGQEADGGGDGCDHVVDCSEGNAVEAGFEIFGAGGVDGNPFGEAGRVAGGWGCLGEGADSFAEEGGFLVLGCGQGDMDLGAEEGDGEAGESSA